jgi:hypothetical protein
MRLTFPIVVTVQSEGTQKKSAMCSCFVTLVKVFPMSKAIAHCSKKQKNLYTMTCGYAVDGLGFYYIPHSLATRPRTEARAAIILVVDGEINSMQLQAEMQRLVLAQTAWMVEELGKNRFKMIFPMKGEMNRMMEWGIVQTKDRKVKLLIEDVSGRSISKQSMRKVREQVTKLPSELTDYLTIWAIGRILGVTKDVDMVH